MAPFNGWGSTASRLRNHFKEADYFLPSSPQKSLVLILSIISGGWKAESTLEPPSGFERGTPGLGIQHLNIWLSVLFLLDLFMRKMKLTQRWQF